MTTLRFAGNIRRLRLRPGDHIVIEAPETAPAELLQGLARETRAIWPDNHCTILVGCHVACVLRKEDADVAAS